MTQTIENSDTTSIDEIGKYLTFQLGEEHYGLPILEVREIIGLMDITTVPRTPRYVRGVINLRGRIIPVLDLRDRFGMPQIDDTEETCIIVVDVELQGVPTLMGVLVDKVQEVLDIEADEIEPAPSFGDGSNQSYIKAMAKGKDRVTVLLCTDQVIQTESMASPIDSIDDSKEN